MSVTEAAEAGEVPRLRLPPLVSAMRPYQWPKNGLVFAALVFSAGEAWKPSHPATWWPLLTRTMALFLLWGLVSSATYLVNDIRDRELDRIHPRKRYRAIARGAVRLRTAWITAALLGTVGIGLSFALDWRAAGVLAGYAVIMFAYSAGLKRVPILDILILSSGVVARAVAGALTINVSISPWLYICSSFAAFFFASSKRWAEHRQLGPNAAQHRPALAQYGSEILGQLLTISASAALLTYALYTIESRNVPRNGAMALTLPWVAFALFRYLMLLDGPRRGDAPDRILFTDPQIVVAFVGFVATALGVLLVAH